jgi:hypothetical protein
MGGVLAAWSVADASPREIVASRPDHLEVLARVLRPPASASQQAAAAASVEPPSDGAAAMAAPVAATAPGRHGALPVGKGMWIWLPEKVEGGNVAALVARAQAVGLTHIYVRTGSSKMGFYAADYLNHVLPAAHAAGLRVYGWDFPYFYDVADDVARSVAAINHVAPGGHRLDGFVPDVETRHEGTQISPEAAAAFGLGLRQVVGPDYPLIVAVPRPSPARLADYPYAEMLAHFDAVAPMVYWLNRQPDTDVAHTMAFFRSFGLPVIPVGQAYDGAPEGGRPGVPPRDELLRFMSTAENNGAVGVSFWSWQHADQQAWDAIRDAHEFRLPDGPDGTRPQQVVAIQTLLSSLGYPAPATGAWDGTTSQAIRSFQTDRGLEVSGVLDPATRAALLSP